MSGFAVTLASAGERVNGIGPSLYQAILAAIDASAAPAVWRARLAVYLAGHENLRAGETVRQPEFTVSVRAS